MIDLVREPPSEDEPWESAPLAGAYFNSPNRAVHADFTADAMTWLAAAGAVQKSGPDRIDDVQVAGIVADPQGNESIVLVHGTYDDTPQAGLRRTDTLKKVGFDAHLLTSRSAARHVIIVTSHLPNGRTGKALLEHVRGFAEVVSVNGDLRGLHRLHERFGGPIDTPPPVIEAVDHQLDLFGGGIDA